MIVTRALGPSPARPGPRLPEGVRPSPADPTAECPNKVRLYHADTGDRLRIACGQRRCEVCGPKWRSRALAAFHSGLRNRNERFLVVLLTAPGNVGPEWNAGASKRWHHFITLVRQTRGLEDVQFYRVAELQHRGVVHYHIVLRGVSFVVDTTARRWAVQAGFGPRVGLRSPRKYRHGVAGMGNYLGKYLLKSYSGNMLPSKSRLLTMSYGWKIDWVSKPKREGTGKWLFAGSARAGWSGIGYEVVVPRAPKAPEWFAPWWRSSWQRARSRWAVTILGAWVDTSASRPLGSQEPPRP